MVKRKTAVVEPTPTPPQATTSTHTEPAAPKKKRAKKAVKKVEPVVAALEAVVDADTPVPQFVVPTEMRFYCLPCKEHQVCPIDDVTVTKSKNNRWQIKGKCPKCTRGLFKFITKHLAENMNAITV